MDVIKLSRYQIVGNYTRYEEQVLNELKDAKFNISAAVQDSMPTRKNFLIWAAPGSGKTYFAQQIADSLSDTCRYFELNLAKLNEAELNSQLSAIANSPDPSLCLIDEIDSKPNESWPYEIMLPFFDSSIDKEPPLVMIMAGSSGFSLTGMKERITSRPKGQDLLSRIPAENQFAIPPISFGDRILIILSQFVQAAQESGHQINSVEKLGLYYVALNERLSNARQLHEFAVRAVERVPRGDDRIKYDHLFTPGDPENKRFWLEVSAVAQDLVNHFVIVEQ